MASTDPALQEQMLVLGEEGSYLIQKTADNIYLLSAADVTNIASAGSGTIKIGTYSQIGGTFEFSSSEVPGLAEAAASTIKGNSGSFNLAGTEYTWEKGEKPKTYDVYSKMEGIVYTKDAGSLDAGFEQALNKAIADGSASFVYGPTTYVLSAKDGYSDVYAVGSTSHPARIYSSYTLDTFTVGEKVPDDFKAAALQAVSEGGRFEANGSSYSIANENGALIIYDSANAEFAEFNLFSVRRYSGEDSMEYGLKKAISAKIEEMLAANLKTGSLTYAIPQQDEDGSAMKDENGNYIMNDTEMKITQLLEGEYVINCDQIKYMIDTFAAPSSAHVLGTDGDGFDMLARVMYGGRVSLMVGFVVVIIETILGVIMGLP